jgi:hypothetical protein
MNISRGAENPDHYPAPQLVFAQSGEREKRGRTAKKLCGVVVEAEGTPAEGKKGRRVAPRPLRATLTNLEDLGSTLP